MLQQIMQIIVMYCIFLPYVAIATSSKQVPFVFSQQYAIKYPVKADMHAPKMIKNEPRTKPFK